MTALLESSTYFDLVEAEPPILGQPQALFNHGFFMTVENVEVSHALMLSPANHQIRMYTDWVLPIAAMERKKMTKAFLQIDLVDIPVMVGSAFFFSSVAGVFWNIASTAPSPVALGITMSISGLAIGKYVSAKARND